MSKVSRMIWAQADRSSIRHFTCEANIQDVLSAMSINQVVSFDAARVCAVRVAASDYGMMTGRRYYTRSDRRQERVEVMRAY